ncbi:uncharacterized protein LOC119073672 isoform X1 [Bradysia coprophila]|uniref:uncharacterized protein LOC119073672 isoform X1 n=1 Tax=Bradysia coprophila TaxID=38358 RepID=UPI00187DC4BA|nr:uncharacterized protein LOC119073672 isoform X1 [Bradysia coprophila]
MFKFIIFCTVASLCVARSLNDDNTPVAVAIEDVALPKDIAVEDIIDESDVAAAFDSNSGDIIDSDKTRGLFFRFTTTAATTTTTPLPMMQTIDLLLTLNSMTVAGRANDQMKLLIL